MVKTNKFRKYSYNGSIRVVGTYHYNHHVN